MRLGLLMPMRKPSRAMVQIVLWPPIVIPQSLPFEFPTNLAPLSSLPLIIQDLNSTKKFAVSLQIPHNPFQPPTLEHHITFPCGNFFNLTKKIGPILPSLPML